MSVEPHRSSGEVLGQVRAGAGDEQDGGGEVEPSGEGDIGAGAEEVLDVFCTPSPESRRVGQQSLQGMFARTADRDAPTSWASREQLISRFMTVRAAGRGKSAASGVQSRPEDWES
ncbi:hypothetical protein LE181_07890 [Streptomyces sp. SCA3-4]|uniref:hypothetical protein n=1 Tax=Streptomyces sichuanensis TaxID=2871810 RepID=UPI001CE34810|nr:hypothetical protein [Streptomyces sichuanensis]MCA6092079.1 hypothetical protein [Streptomyces sichuanensis]